MQYTGLALNHNKAESFLLSPPVSDDLAWAAILVSAIFLISRNLQYVKWPPPKSPPEG